MGCGAGLLNSQAVLPDKGGFSPTIPFDAAVLEMCT